MEIYGAEDSGMSGGSVDRVDRAMRPIHSIQYAVHYEQR
jgi:hypothetical protein